MVDELWLTQALNDTSTDILGLSMQYISGAPPIYNDEGLQIAGQASYGPLDEAGNRIEGSDFNDYLGISWMYPSGDIDTPEVSQLLSLDCSGFMRMVWGYRAGFPISLKPSINHDTIPRRAFEMEASALGTMIKSNTGTQITNFNGASILNGSGLYVRSFRSIRRL